MKKVFILACLILCLGLPSCYALVFSKLDRVLILAPHPDDEVLALGGIIQQALKNGAKVKIIYLTNGDYNELSYLFYKKGPALTKGGFINIGKTRQAEAYAATSYLGLSKNDLIFLGYPDRFTEAILTSFWDKKYPAVSLLTHINEVPYENSLSFKAPYIGNSILTDIKQVLKNFKPTIIFVSSPQDTNPDHRSLYVFLNVALLDLADNFKAAAVYPYLVHRPGWPKTRKYLPSSALYPPPTLIGGDIIWKKNYLTEEEIEKKRKAITLYKSQVAIAKNYFLSFVRRNELFSAYPVIDLGINRIGTLQDNSKLVSRIEYSRGAQFLVINIKLNKNVAELIKADIYLLGYKKDKSFASMPKIFFKAKDNAVFAYEKRKRIFSDEIKAVSQDNVISIKFPLQVLDNPDYIFSRVILKGRIFALYTTAWRLLKL
jgi:LmbE family N-acetylglucosaminyl deacetylase